MARAIGKDNEGIYMKLKKIICIVIALSVLGLSFTSCGKLKEPEDLIEKADNNLTRLAHSVELEFDYVAEDDSVADLFDQLDGGETVIHFDGDDAKIEQRMSMKYGEDNADFFGNYVIKDGTVYANSGYTYAGTTSYNKVKADVSDEERTSLIEKAGAIIGVGIENFAFVSCEKIDGEYIIQCTEATNDLNIKLEKTLIAQFEDADVSVKVENARMIIEIDDGKYDTVRVMCDYEVTLYSQTYNVGAMYELEYDYDDKVKISKPDDAYAYGDSLFENILNTL